jgi:hypothetical protein
MAIVQRRGGCCDQQRVVRVPDLQDRLLATRNPFRISQRQPSVFGEVDGAEHRSKPFQDVDRVDNAN